ncbi:MAG TPA: hypothetical protein VK890_05965, partial [Bacteroidia bacterium]|nr:hypothetical protein [Bacteroidia bacterium]
MKKNITLLLLILPFLVKAVNYTSIANGNWNVSTNWNPHGIPGASDTATINTSITFNTAESIFTIIINSSQTLTVSGANTLTVKGNFTNNGTFTPATGTVTFNSTGAKTLGGSTQTTFYILTSGNSGSLTLGNNITTTSDLDIYSGTFDVSASNYSVTVGGDFLMNGTFTYQNGTVTMNGSSAPTLGGSNLFMNNLIINGAVTMINTCRVLNCTINSGYSLTQTSSAVFVVRGDLTNNGTYTAAFH